MPESEEKRQENAAAADSFEQDLRTFVLHEHKVRTKDGDLISVPRCSWGKELKIIRLISDLMKALVSSGVLSQNISTEEAIAKAMATALETAPETLTQAVCILMEKDRKWVEESLESEEMLRLVLPFLSAKRQTIGKLLAPYFQGGLPLPGMTKEG